MFLCDTCQIEKYFQDDFLILNFQRADMGLKYFIPPWIFDLPQFVYSKRNEYLSQINLSGVIDFNMWKIAELQPIPILLINSSDLTNVYNSIEIKDWEKSFIKSFVQVEVSDRLSLPFIYLSILKNFLLNLTSQQYNFSPKEYRNLIYYDLSMKQMPLFILDPLNIIDELITSLTILWLGDHAQIKQYKKFRLLNYNILQGQKSKDEHWKTLIAYCGGWTNNGKCGKNPLVLGLEQHCPECGKLVCKACGFCSMNCPNSSSYNNCF